MQDSPARRLRTGASAARRGGYRFIARHMDDLRQWLARAPARCACGDPLLPNSTQCGGPWKRFPAFALRPLRNFDLRPPSAMAWPTLAREANLSGGASVRHVGGVHRLLRRRRLGIRGARLEQASNAGPSSGGAIHSPMPGRVISVDVRHGDRVVAGQRLVALEAMKMEMCSPLRPTASSGNCALTWGKLSAKAHSLCALIRRT
jgi:hypothetical protein